MKTPHIIRWIAETHFRVWRAVLRGRTVNITRYFCVFLALILSGCRNSETTGNTLNLTVNILTP